MVKKLITLDGLAVFLSELRKEINAGAGKCFDAEELARRIPAWQWKVTLPKTTHQTVTATVGEQTYTSDFYAQQGSVVTFSAKADPGYIAGSLSATSVTLNKDLTVTVTAATESENIEAGTKTFSSSDTFIVPPKVNVLKWTWNWKDTYTKVKPGQSFNISVGDMDGRYILIKLSYFDNDGPIMVSGDISNSDDSKDPLFVSWSTKINEHAIDHDWSGGAIATFLASLNLIGQKEIRRRGLFLTA